MTDLKHQGVKGMKWGHHKQKQLDRYTRIASGNANFGDKVSTTMSVSVIDLLRNKGSVKKIAAGRAFALQMQKQRIESGNATTRDKLDRALNTSIVDLARGR